MTRIMMMMMERAPLVENHCLVSYLGHRGLKCVIFNWVLCMIMRNVFRMCLETHILLVMCSAAWE